MALAAIVQAAALTLLSVLPNVKIMDQSVDCNHFRAARDLAVPRVASASATAIGSMTAGGAATSTVRFAGSVIALPCIKHSEFSVL
jgi:hypothetical protein